MHSKYLKDSNKNVNVKMSWAADKMDTGCLMSSNVNVFTFYVSFLSIGLSLMSLYLLVYSDTHI